MGYFGLCGSASRFMRPAMSYVAIQTLGTPTVNLLITAQMTHDCLATVSLKVQWVESCHPTLLHLLAACTNSAFPLYCGRKFTTSLGIRRKNPPLEKFNLTGVQYE